MKKEIKPIIFIILLLSLTSIAFAYDYTQNCEAAGSCSCKSGVLGCDCAIDECDTSCPDPSFSHSTLTGNNCGVSASGCLCWVDPVYGTYPWCYSSSCSCNPSGNCQYTCDEHYFWTGTGCGCADSSVCSSGEYCHQESHTCEPLPTCAEANSGYGYNPQENDEDLHDDCSVTDWSCSDGCNKYRGDGFCAGGSYPDEEALQISAGHYHTCALLSSGDVDCWGSGSSEGCGGGEYGQADDYSGGDAVGVSAGYFHSCAVLTDGDVHCWGDNGDGQADDYGGGDATAVSAGGGQGPSCAGGICASCIVYDSHTCALLSNGNVHCWGDNGDGQADDYSGGDAVAVSAGRRHSCAVLTDGDVDCWGNNDYGQVSDYSGGDAVAVSAGEDHTCALLSNGDVDCWGKNGWGQANDYSGGDAVAVGAGAVHTCAVLNDGSVHCWGANEDGQANDYSGGDAVGVGAGGLHSCAVLNDGSVHCWGYNYFGQADDYNGVDYLCDTDDDTSSCGASTACSGGDCSSTYCNGTDHCSGDTYYTGYTCDGSGNCDVDAGDIGCCESSYCASGEYCDESSHTCKDLPTCAEANSGFGYNPQENDEDLWDDCDESAWFCAEGGCEKLLSGTGLCAGGIYECDEAGDSTYCPADSACSGGECTATFCNTTNLCSGDTYYNGSTCDGSGDCDVPEDDIGCCETSYCTSGQCCDPITHSCGECDNSQDACENGGHVWISSVLGGSNNPCCGDDGGDDDFYNSSLACVDASITSDKDDLQGFCEINGYDWFTGSLGGDNSPCCGDDGGDDDFYNSSLECYNGGLSTERDLIQGFCEAGGYDWFTGNLTGFNSPCCGDDDGGTALDDAFGNTTNCCYLGTFQEGECTFSPTYCMINHVDTSNDTLINLGDSCGLVNCDNYFLIDSDIDNKWDGYCYNAEFSNTCTEERYNSLGDLPGFKKNFTVSVEGNLELYETGEAVQDAKIYVIINDNEYSDKTNENGTYIINIPLWELTCADSRTLTVYLSYNGNEYSATKIITPLK